MTQPPGFAVFKRAARGNCFQRALLPASVKSASSPKTRTAASKSPSRHAILATGRTRTPAPFPGWTLPNVFALWIPALVNPVSCPRKTSPLSQETGPPSLAVAASSSRRAHDRRIYDQASSAADNSVRHDLIKRPPCLSPLSSIALHFSVRLALCGGQSPLCEGCLRWSR